MTNSGIDELTIYNLSVKYPNTVDLVREVEKISRANAIMEYKAALKEDINCRLKSVEKFLEAETLDAWRQATSTFKDAIDYFAEQIKDVEE